MTFADAEVLARAQHAVDEVLPEGLSVEVLEGMLVVNPPPSLAHALLTDHIGRALERLAPAGSTVNWAGIGVHEHDDAAAEYQVPDVVVFRPPPPGAPRLVGAQVDVVVEVVSPANRRAGDYAHAVAARARRYGIPWALVIDPDTRSLAWFHDGLQHPTGPDWAAALDVTATFG